MAGLEPKIDEEVEDANYENLSEIIKLAEYWAWEVAISPRSSPHISGLVMGTKEFIDKLLGDDAPRIFLAPKTETH